MVERWVTALTDIIRDLNHQYTALTEEAQADQADLRQGVIDSQTAADNSAERAGRKRRMARFKRGIETRLSEAKRLVKQHNINRTQTEDHEMRYRYREAIKAHRDASTKGGFEPEDHDLDLWEVLIEYGDQNPPYPTGHYADQVNNHVDEALDRSLARRHPEAEGIGWPDTRVYDGDHSQGHWCFFHNMRHALGATLSPNCSFTTEAAS
jgi:hypothetical protein